MTQPKATEFNGTQFVKSALKQAWAERQVIFLLGAFFGLLDWALSIPISKDLPAFFDAVLSENASEDSLQQYGYVADYIIYLAFINLALMPLSLSLYARLAGMPRQALFAGGKGAVFQRYTHVFWIMVKLLFLSILALWLVSLATVLAGVNMILSIALLIIVLLQLFGFTTPAILLAAQDRVLTLQKTQIILEGYKGKFASMNMILSALGLILLIVQFQIGQILQSLLPDHMISHGLVELIAAIAYAFYMYVWFAATKQALELREAALGKPLTDDPRQTPWDKR